MNVPTVVVNIQSNAISLPYIFIFVPKKIPKNGDAIRTSKPIIVIKVNTMSPS